MANRVAQAPVVRRTVLQVIESRLNEIFRMTVKLRSGLWMISLSVGFDVVANDGVTISIRSEQEDGGCEWPEDRSGPHPGSTIVSSDRELQDAVAASDLLHQ